MLVGIAGFFGKILCSMLPNTSFILLLFTVVILFSCCGKVFTVLSGKLLVIGSNPFVILLIATSLTLLSLLLAYDLIMLPTLGDTAPVDTVRCLISLALEIDLIKSEILLPSEFSKILLLS